MDYFTIEVSAQQIRQEKEKARELRRSRWWADRIARGRCHYCEGTFPAAELTMDHVVPLARGGRSSRGNIVPACKECNSRKNYLLPMEWDDFLNGIKGER